VTLEWRQPQLSRVVHLAEPSAHRALCGADVLSAYTDRECPRDLACRSCRSEAERRSLDTPPLTAPTQRDTETGELEL
jgi:hypothetical protein